MSYTIGLDGVGVSFGPTRALERVTLELAAGSFTAVVGPSGCGKSTLLRVLAGMLEPTTGRAEVGGRLPDEVRRRKEIGWMAQQPALLPWRTALDNVLLAQTLGVRAPDRSPAELLAMVGMSEFADSYPGALSGGMQQRVALARTLAVGAPVWLMDEPFSALDELTRETLADDLLAIWAELRPTVVWVTHHIPEAVKLADRLVLMTPRPGTVADQIDVDLARPRDEVTPEFQGLVARTRAVLRPPTPIEMVS